VLSNDGALTSRWAPIMAAKRYFETSPWPPIISDALTPGRRSPANSLAANSRYPPWV